jgi:hypothetical protein
VAHVHFKLPDELVRDAREAGLVIAHVTEQALRASLAGRAIEPEEAKATPPSRGGDVDATDRYQEGLAAGQHWIQVLATAEEIAGLAALRSSRWRDFGIDTRTHSLGGMLVENGELTPATDGKAWLQRDAFAEGLIDAVVGSGLA